MSLYPVDSPGGYQMTGRTVSAFPSHLISQHIKSCLTHSQIPCFDMLGTKSGFSPSRPWLFQDFDLITYTEVSEAELNRLLAKFACGEYEWDYEATEFDMREHNKLLEDTRARVVEIRARQAVAQEEMVKAEADSLARWREEKARSRVDEGTVDELLAGE